MLNKSVSILFSIVMVVIITTVFIIKSCNNLYIKVPVELTLVDVIDKTKINREPYPDVVFYKYGSELNNWLKVKKFKPDAQYIITDECILFKLYFLSDDSYDWFFYAAKDISIKKYHNRLFIYSVPIDTPKAQILKSRPYVFYTF